MHVWLWRLKGKKKGEKYAGDDGGCLWMMFVKKWSFWILFLLYYKNYGTQVE